jgi:ABC-type dipeptide/oligopeptide/nickel transport system ATPase component
MPAPANNGDHPPGYWRQGEHVAVIGDTGTGKTFLMAKLVALRSHVIILRTKPDDIKFPGFLKREHAVALDHVYAERLLIQPEYERQAFEGWWTLEKVWKHGGWCVVIDELWYAEQMLKLQKQVNRLLTQGRSKGITVMVGMQRPAQISRFAISQCTHVFAFQTEGRDTKTIAEATTPKIADAMVSLSGHDFVYYNRRERTVRIGNARRLGAIFQNARHTFPPTLGDTAGARTAK